MDGFSFPSGEDYRSYFEKLRRRVERALQGLPIEAPYQIFGQRLYPPVNVYESPTSVVVRAEVPGVQKEDMDVTVSGNMLTISGKELEDPELAKLVCHRSERNWGEFSRSVRLPESADPEGEVQAKLADGILEITIPKVKTHQPRKISFSE